MITRPKEWTLWRVRRELRSMIEELQAEKRERGKPLTFFAKTIFTRRGLHSDIVRRWSIEYGNDPEIRSAVSMMKDIFESRSVEGALNKQIDPFVAMFNLENNYGWKKDPDASERDGVRLNIEVAELRKRLGEEVNDARLLPHGNSTHSKAV